MAVGDDKIADFKVDNYAALKLKQPQREICSVPITKIQCSAAKKILCSAAGDLSPVIEADSMEQNGRRENVRIFGVEEEPGEDAFAKVVSVAKKAGVSIIKNDVSICHRLTSMVLPALNH